MAWAVYEVRKWETHSGTVTVETLERIAPTERDAQDHASASDIVIRELPGNVKPTPMCACGDPFRYEHDGERRYLRCYGCRSSRDEGAS